MFTGLIEHVGTLSDLGARVNYRVMTIQSAYDPNELTLGESISCDGACLTVVRTTQDAIIVEASQETLARTIAGSYRVGSKINLERALTVGSRLGGHFVMGHVDASGTVDRARAIGESWEMAIAYDRAFDRLVIDKGSIAINGVSLTVNESKPGWLSVNIIPHTAENTNLLDLKTGDRVNLEFDMIGKYILKMHNTSKASGLTIEKLMENGW